MKKFLVTIEGGDCTFKETQTKLLRDTLSNIEGITLGPEVAFPVYDESAYYINNYLSGKSGYTHLDPKIICSFYATNRLVDYHNRWQDNYNQGEVIVADRYYGSNMIHQTTYFSDINEIKEMCDWIQHTECEINGIPKPDLTILLSMHPKVVCDMIEERMRNNGHKNGEEVDVLEDDVFHIYDVYRTGLKVAKLYGWKVVKCFNGSSDPFTEEELSIRTREEIHKDILIHFLNAYNKE